MPPVLAIDTCGTTGLVEIIGLPAGESLAAATLPGRETQERLLPAIESTLSEAGIAAGALSALAVVTGPGSFTGVRIGLAAVKGLAEALHLPVVALSRLEVLQEAAGEPTGRRTHAWLDAGRGDVYARLPAVEIADGDGGVELLLSRAEALARVAQGDEVFVLEESLAGTEPGVRLVLPEQYREALRRLVLRCVEQGTFADQVLVDANYLRVPDAELVLRARTAALTQPSTITGGAACPPPA